MVTLLVIVVDQFTKIIVKLGMIPGEGFPVFGDFFKIHFVENPGAAFGVTLRSIAPSMSEDAAKITLTAFSFVAMFAIVYLLWYVRKLKNALPILIALILGGAIGNLVDRIFYGMWFSHLNDYAGGFMYGRVVDMFYIDIYEGYMAEWVPIWGGDYIFLWPIFNVADMAISIGVVTIMVFQNRYFAKEEPKVVSDTEAHLETRVSETADTADTDANVATLSTDSPVVSEIITTEISSSEEASINKSEFDILESQNNTTESKEKQ